ncbi:myelin-oligodendrocyte glycoprotein-like [Emydura macquarii macquarii]|uniref:myelin-oligodendrocyte glycoprotein-like n=1 Tax=Emydura macquarii macquarii TaxID=1129001 RepID=UPI003529E6DC
MLCLAWCLALLGGVAAESDTAPQVGNSPHLYHLAGQDVTLECRVQVLPEMDPRQLRVHWHLLREPAEISVVHSYHEGANQLGDQAEEFRDRTQLLLQGIRQGVAVLTLANVRPSDNGTYRCFLMDGRGAESMDIVLRVAAAEPRFPGWLMAVLMLTFVTFACAVLIHWVLPLIPAEGFHIRW